MKKFENILAGILMGMLFCMIAYALTSCSHKGYGCRGNYSWNRMVWKNTRP